MQENCNKPTNIFDFFDLITQNGPDFELVKYYNVRWIKEVSMSRKRYRLDQIIEMLEEGDMGFSRRLKLGQICRNLGITEQV